MHRSTLMTGALIVSLAPSVACDIDTFVPPQAGGGPAGIIEGSVTYVGPAPCTRGGEIVGAAALLAFEEKLLPPPEGLGTQPAGLTVISAEELFRGVRSELEFDPGGGVVCPAPGSAPVVVSAPWRIGPLTGGTYQVRGFYDLDGDFNPAFSIFNLPSRGDIGGGAVLNAEAALQGAPVVYRGVPIGDLQADGSRVVGPNGALVEGVAVTLGLTIPLERPIFHIAEVRDDNGSNNDPDNIVVPADYQLAVFNAGDPSATESSFIRLVLGAGVHGDERELATANPFFFPSADPFFFFTRQDVNGDAVLDGDDHLPESTAVPSLLPLGLLTRLADGTDLASQASPSVILQGVTLYEDLVQTALSPPELAEAKPTVTVALRPAVLCIDTADPSKDAVLLNTSPTDGAGTVLIADEAALEAELAVRFGRTVHIEYGCLPQGRYGVNLVYGTGQAWTLPNEAGICAPAEPPNSDASVCGTRPRLGSQSVAVTIGPPSDPSYCAANPTPTACLK